MRITQLVTLVAPDGSFGGPVRVARAQCAALAEMGHDVTLWAAAPVKEPTESTVDGYRLRLYPARRVSRRLGFAGMWAEGMVDALRSSLDKTDVAHVHLARDLVTLRGASVLQRNGVPFVVQPHGMILPTSHPLSRPVDAIWTRRLLRSAREVLVLTADEDEKLHEVEPQTRSVRVKNGVAITDVPAYEGRPPIVLFLARLHQRKRPVAFVEMAALLSEAYPELRFVIAGPDEGELAAVLAARIRLKLEDAVEVRGAVSPEETDALLRSARVYVLPSFGEVFPMSLTDDPKRNKTAHRQKREHCESGCWAVMGQHNKHPVIRAPPQLISPER